MATITEDYVKSLPPIYRDILSAFPTLEPTRKAGYGLAYQTIYAHLQSPSGKYVLGEIMLACKQMEGAGVVEVKNNIFVHPTQVGEEIIGELTGNGIAPVLTVPPFPKLPG